MHRYALDLQWIHKIPDMKRHTSSKYPAPSTPPLPSPLALSICASTAIQSGTKFVNGARAIGGIVGNARDRAAQNPLASDPVTTIPTVTAFGRGTRESTPTDRLKSGNLEEEAEDDDDDDDDDDVVVVVVVMMMK